jgi:hypothetical protein
MCIFWESEVDAKMSNDWLGFFKLQLKELQENKTPIKLGKSTKSCKPDHVNKIT